MAATITRTLATLASSFFRAAGMLITSGRFRRCCWYQNMNAQCAVRLTEQTRIVRTAVRRTSPRNRSAMPGAGVGRLSLGRSPFLGLGNLAANPEDEQGRQHADQEDHARALARQQERRARGQQDADVDAALEHRGDPGPPAPGPRLRQQRGADRPLAADAEGGQESYDEQLPPRLHEKGQAGEQRVGEDRQAERPAAADQVADAAEATAAERPADQERGLDPGAVPARRLRSACRSLRSARRRTGPRPGRKDACPGRRTASRARRRSPTSTGTARGREGSGSRRASDTSDPSIDIEPPARG